MKTFLYHENGWRMFQAEELPVKPELYEWIDQDYTPSYVYEEYYKDLKSHKSKIAALKAKSIPIENILVWKLWACQNILEEVLTSDIGIHEWPGDVEIKDGVAILTLPKEQQQ